jgi:hypothetical protein
MVISTPPEGWVCTVQVKQPAYHERLIREGTER